MLAIQYPIEYQSHFVPLMDFEVIDASLWPGGVYPTPLPEIWVDLSKGSKGHGYMSQATTVIYPGHCDPFINLSKLDKIESDVYRKVGIHTGSVKFLERLGEVVDLVAIPNDILPARSIYANLGPSNYHYYEYCNLDELRHRPPRSLHTSAPITAAMAGIDLRLRERRPKSLPAFGYDLKLSPERLELAILNVLAIKEALDEGRNNSTPT